MYSALDNDLERGAKKQKTAACCAVTFKRAVDSRQPTNCLYMKHMNQFYALSFCFFKTHCNIIFPFTPRSSVWSLQLPSSKPYIHATISFFKYVLP
jgi:hypothetical protein